MASNVYVGLALTAHNNDGRINTSTFDHVTVTGTTPPLPPTVVELTDGGFSEAGGVFLNNRVGVENFSTTFTFQITPGTNPMADGLAFVIQGAGPTALSIGGGGLGYGLDHPDANFRGIPHSLAIKFDIYNNSGEGVNSTGIFTNGRSPTMREPGLGAGFPDTSINLDGTGINLNSGHLFRVALTFNGATLTETITDTVTGATFTTSYAVNIPVLVGSDVGYMGFTGGTGGLSAVQDILSWTVQTTLPKHDTQPQLAANGPAPDDGAAALTATDLALIAHEAVSRWAAAGLSDAQVQQLNRVHYEIGAIGGGALGLTAFGSRVVTLDATAAGHGWFIDLTPADDVEFADAITANELRADSDSPSFARMDLLTVVAHELGHVLGFEDLDALIEPHDLLTETLSTGVRRLPATDEAKAPLVSPTKETLALGSVATPSPLGILPDEVWLWNSLTSGNVALSGALMWLVLPQNEFASPNTDVHWPISIEPESTLFPESGWRDETDPRVVEKSVDQAFGKPDVWDDLNEGL